MKLSHRLSALVLALLLTLNLSACQRRVEPEAPEEPSQPPAVEEEIDVPSPPEKKPEKEPEPPKTGDNSPKILSYVFPSERDYPDDEAGAEQKAFDEFLLEEFVSSLEDDYLNIHTTLVDPSHFGIDKTAAEVTIGDAVSEEFLAEARANNLELKERFEAFNYDLLTEEQQESYKLYQFLLENALTSLEGDFPYMDWAFSPMQGLQNGIVSMLMEFEFYSLEDVDAYMAMMKDIPRYVDDVLEFSRKQERMGYFMPDTAAHSAMQYCKSVIKDGENAALLTAILHNLEHCELLNEQQKAAYCDEARRFFVEELIPCYQKIHDTLDFLTDERNNQMGLAHLKNGKEYYELLFRQRSGSDRSVSETKELLHSYLKLALKEISNIADKNSELYRGYLYGDDSAEFSGLNDVILDLEEQIFSNFPYIESVDYTISYLDSQVAVDGIGAYYVVPPIDSKEVQKIKVNPDWVGSETSLDTYTLLAHEGLPGHLYQSNYAFQNISEPFRLDTSILGYSEGYASYVELISLNYLRDRVDPDLIRLNQCYTIFNNCMVAICDIGIHYEGWTLEDMENFCGKYINMQDGSDLYEQLLGDPAAFQSYYTGLIEFIELRNCAESMLGEDFDEKEFHALLLEGGDLPFSILWEKLDAYIADKQG